MSFPFFTLFYNRWFIHQTSVATNLTGRAVLVTGANVGVGYETSVSLLQMNPKRLILAVRDPKKGQDAVESMKKRVGGSTTTEIDVWKLDYADFQSVKEFVKKANDELERLDILVLNAGLAKVPWTTTKDGWEIQVQVNVLSTAALALGLLHKVNGTSELAVPEGGVPFKPHLELVASETHESAKFNERKDPNILAALNDEKKYSGIDRYATTKLLDVYIAKQVSKLEAAKNTLVSSTCPGFTVSNLRKELPWYIKPVIWVFEVLTARPTAEGAKTIVYAATQETYNSGDYLSSSKVSPGGLLVNTKEGQELQERFWKELTEFLQKQGFTLAI